jgi:putative transposase
MKKDTPKRPKKSFFGNWFDPVETILRSKVRGFLETMIEAELEAALARPRYGRRSEPIPDRATTTAIIGHPAAR